MYKTNNKHDGYTYKTDEIITKLFTSSIPEALQEIEKRRADTNLIKRVEEYLENDIPLHFQQSKPVFYLSRHLATPNYEVDRVIEMTKSYENELIIGQDVKGTFVTNNALKLSLGKLPVVKETSTLGDEIIENFTIIDFAQSQGKPMSDISTKYGKSLPTFHHDLFKQIYPKSPEIVDESDWVDRNNREDIQQQYRKMLALLCVHGIMLESYTPEELRFVTEVVDPAFKAVEETIGVRPLIIEHIPQDLEVTRNWNSYPPNIYNLIINQLLYSNTNPLNQQDK